MERGDAVRVRNTFTGGWSAGFEVAERLTLPDPPAIGYRIRRPGEAHVLPAVFPEADVRPHDE